MEPRLHLWFVGPRTRGEQGPQKGGQTEAKGGQTGRGLNENVRGLSLYVREGGEVKGGGA